MSDITINVSGHDHIKEEVDAKQKGLAILLERKVVPRMDAKGLLVNTRRLAHEGLTYVIVNESLAVLRKSESNIKVFEYSKEHGFGFQIENTLKSEAKLFDVLFAHITAQKGGVTQPELAIDEPTAEEHKSVRFIEQLFSSKILQEAKAALTPGSRPYIQEVRLPIYASSEFDAQVVQELHICTVVDKKEFDKDEKQPDLEAEKQPVIFVNSFLGRADYPDDPLNAAKQFDYIIGNFESKLAYTTQRSGESTMFFADAGKVGASNAQKMGMLSLCKSPVYLESVEIGHVAKCDNQAVQELFEESSLKFYFCGYVRKL